MHRIRTHTDNTKLDEEDITVGDTEFGAASSECK